MHNKTLGVLSYWKVSIHVLIVFHFFDFLGLFWLVCEAEEPKTVQHSVSRMKQWTKYRSEYEIGRKGVL